MSVASTRLLHRGLRARVSLYRIPTKHRRLMSTEPGKLISTKLSFQQMNHASICGTILVGRCLPECVIERHRGLTPAVMLCLVENSNQLFIIVERFFVNHQIELLPWPAHSPDLSPIENMWPMVVQRLTQITPPAATPDQLWQCVEAAWSALPQEHIQSLFESMPRRVAAVIFNNGGYSGY
ncbi:transposable element Tcb1 transposase [Trichonephila clavipes]|nr:transposable element Tcb1 transposase [Trichonephila clavipes]